ncbi:MAG: WecB/TagA/CpsF family glycosyltransferase [Candidatus Nanoarchaeia archaeon]
MEITDKHSLKEIGQENKILNFINLNTIWWTRNNNSFKQTLSKKYNINFIDSRILSLILRLRQQRGPTFTREFLFSEKARNKKHFFIGLEEVELKKLSNLVKIPIKNLRGYEPYYLKQLEFSLNERDKILSKLKKYKPHFVWICIGSPKQEILANQLFDKYSAIYLNVGAALDFILKRKKEAPLFMRKIGLEWFYRGITDFKYSKIKIWRSFIGLGYIINKKIRLKLRA